MLALWLNVKHSSGMTIIEYMKKRGLSQRETARLLELDEAQLCRYVSGRTRPQLAVAARIEKQTAGEVPALSWLQIEAR